MKQFFAILLALCLLASCTAALAEKTYCNPLTLPNLQIQPKPFFPIPETEDQINMRVEIAQEMLAQEAWIPETEGRKLSSVGNVMNPVDNACRTGADPTAFFHDGVCYLYATGDCVTNYNCWYTTDFATWEGYAIDVVPTAPSVIEVNGKFYMAGNSSPVYVADGPLGPWSELGNFILPDGTETNGYSDVCFFLDDDGRLYLNYSIGCPIMGAELDPEKPNQLLTDPVAIFEYDVNRPWTHAGSSFQDFTYGTCEGGQIFKYRGNYYFQVSSNGTDNASYCIGILRADTPLGPYVVEQPNNPVTKPCVGMMEGAGHGLFVEDPENGALILFYTSIVGHVATWYGRRISMDVCSIDADGNISVTKTETPQIVPSALEPADTYDTDAGLFNLSKWMGYWTNNTTDKGSGFYAIDDSMNSWWTPTEEEPVYISGFGGVFNLYAVQICWKEFGFDFTRYNAVQYTVQYCDLETGEWKMLIDKSENTEALVEEYVPVEPVMTCAIRVTILGCTDNCKIGITELRAFGENYTIAAEHGIPNYMAQ